MTREISQSERSEHRRLRVGFSLLAFAAACSVTVAVAQYSPAKSGWLYVVTSDYGRTGQVVVLDPVAGRVVGALARGWQPDVAVSPDGSRLYLTYIESGDNFRRGVFEVIDAATGLVIHQMEDVDPWPAHGSNYASKMAVSRDGRQLFLSKLRNEEDGTQTVYVETFDTQSNLLLPKTAPLPLCGPAKLVPSAQRAKLYAICSRSQDVRVLMLSDDGSSVDGQVTRFSAEGGAGRSGQDVSTGFLTPDGRVFTIVKGDGRFLRVDVTARRTLQDDVVDRAARKLPDTVLQPAGQNRRASTTSNRQDWLAGRRFWNQSAVLSPDGSQLYLPMLSEDPHEWVDEVAVMNAVTLERMRSIKLSRRAESITISRDGRSLYAVDALNGAIMVIDAQSGRELRTIAVGKNPVFAVVAP